MSLSGSLSNALSGLSAASRGAQIVSSNLANAMNENYGRRELSLVALGGDHHGGVRSAGVLRHVDPILLADRRSAGSTLEQAARKSESLDALANIVGTPEDAGSLNGHLRRLEAALAYAESDPGSEVRLSEVVRAGGELVDTFHTAQDGISKIRTRADAQIHASVKQLNSNLERIEQLNAEIVAASVNGRDTSGQMDRRQVLIDQVNALVPVREMPRAHGMVSLVTAKGMIVLGDRATTFEFAPSHTIMPHMTVDQGLLGTLKAGDVSFDMGSDRSPMAGGTLQGLFNTRDETSLRAQSQLDALAFEVADRFSDLAVDTTSLPGAPGLFTDSGARADSANQTGLAGRLQIHQSVDPAQGGQAWRVRSGLAAVTPGAPGNASLITQMLEAMTQRIAPVSGQFQASGALSDHAAALQSNVGTAAWAANQELSFASAHHEQLLQLQRMEGVDSDAELQRLLSIETNYAANAKVIQMIDDMLSTLMRIG